MEPSLIPNSRRHSAKDYVKCHYIKNTNTYCMIYTAKWPGLWRMSVTYGQYRRSLHAALIVMHDGRDFGDNEESMYCHM